MARISFSVAQLEIAFLKSRLEDATKEDINSDCFPVATQRIECFYVGTVKLSCVPQFRQHVAAAVPMKGYEALWKCRISLIALGISKFFANRHGTAGIANRFI